MSVWSHGHRIFQRVFQHLSINFDDIREVSNASNRAVKRNYKP